MDALEQTQDNVQIELHCDTLQQLFADAVLCAADLKSLNHSSNQRVKQLLRDSLKAKNPETVGLP